MKINYGGGADPVDVRINSGMTIVMDRDEVEPRQGMGGGPEVVRLRVNDEEGLGAFFWITVLFNGQGRPVVEVSTELGEDVTRKKVTGVCKKL